MTYLLVAVVSIVAVELLLRLPLGRPLQSLLLLSNKIPRVLGARHISDHWKEKVLQRYACQLAAASLILFLWLVIFSALILAVVLAFEKVLSPEPALLVYLAGVQGLLLVTALSLIYYGLRRYFGRS